jgi:hypothetical protein
MVGPDLANHTAFLADDQDAAAFFGADDIAMDFAIDPNAIGKAKFTLDQGAFTNEGANGRLGLFFEPHETFLRKSTAAGSGLEGQRRSA